MEKIMCDICEKNEATKKYKCKKREKMWNREGWRDWKQLDICEDCAKKILGIAKRRTSKAPKERG